MAWSRAALLEMSARPCEPHETGDRDRCEAARAAVEAGEELVGNVVDADGTAPSIPVAQESARASSTPQGGLLLYRLVRALRPQKVVEFGSALGVSGCYIASALRANGAGLLWTVEGSPSRQAIAERTVESVANGWSRSVCAMFDDSVELLDDADLFFLDGSHFLDPTLRYVDEATRRMRRPAVLVLDDVASYSAQMDEAWARLRRDRRFSHSVRLGRVGLLSLGEPAWTGLPRPSPLRRLHALRQR